MLDFMRQEGESIVIDDTITITVLEVDGDNVLLRIDSPEGATVEPGELLNLARSAGATDAQSVWRLD